MKDLRRSLPLNLSVSGSEEGAEQAKQALLKAVGKVTDIVSSLGFSWWQGGPPHTQSLKDLHWVSTHQMLLHNETVIPVLISSRFFSLRCSSGD